MVRVSTAQARQHLSDLLDAAERGEVVVIERRGVRFGLRTERPDRKPRQPVSLIEYADPAVRRGRWTWEAAPDGLRFADRRRRRGT